MPMDFAFTEEQSLIRTEVRHMARKFDWEYWRTKDKTGEYPHEFFDEFAKAGWLGIAIPKDHGGAGLGITDACILLLEIAASGAGTTGCAPVHFGIFPPLPIVKYGTDEQKQRYLPKLATGELRMAFSVTEPDAGTDTSRITTRAVRDGDDWVVHGRKIWTSKALESELVLLLARTDPDLGKGFDGLSLFLADLDRRYVDIRAIPKLGRNDAGLACGEQANSAKWLAAEAGFFAADRAVQTLGGMGYASEYHVERYWREAR